MLEVARQIDGSERSLPDLTLDFVMSSERSAQRCDRVERRCHGKWIRCVVGLGRLEHSTLYGSSGNNTIKKHLRQRFLFARLGQDSSRRPHFNASNACEWRREFLTTQGLNSLFGHASL